jgi:AcrR family transcriptional regulator
MLPNMPTDVAPPVSSRRDEVLELAYRYVLDRGISAMSLRPLATAVGSSPRVLLFLFGSKDGLVRALLARARADELQLLERVRSADGDRDLPTVVAAVWAWLAAPEHRALLRLWAEGYSRSLVEPDGPWGGFARATVEDWLELLGDAQPLAVRTTARGISERTLALAVLRGALLDLLATEDLRRVTTTVDRYVVDLRSPDALRP